MAKEEREQHKPLYRSVAASDKKIKARENFCRSPFRPTLGFERRNRSIQREHGEEGETKL
jgi:hypothetical protein